MATRATFDPLIRPFDSPRVTSGIRPRFIPARAEIKKKVKWCKSEEGSPGTRRTKFGRVCSMIPFPACSVSQKSSARSRSNSRVRNVIQIRLVEIRIRIDDFWTRACAHRRSFERGKRNVWEENIQIFFRIEDTSRKWCFVACHDLFAWGDGYGTPVQPPWIIIKIGNTRLERAIGIYFHV